MLLVLGFVLGTLTEFALVHISDNPLPTLLPSCSKRAPKVLLHDIYSGTTGCTANLTEFQVRASAVPGAPGEPRSDGTQSVSLRYADNLSVVGSRLSALTAAAPLLRCALRFAASASLGQVFEEFGRGLWAASIRGPLRTFRLG